MGDLSAEPSMEDILSSIKRIIAEENDAAPTRAKRPARQLPARSDPDPFSEPFSGRDEVLELSDPAPEHEALHAPRHFAPVAASASPVAATPAPAVATAPTPAPVAAAPFAAPAPIVAAETPAAEGLLSQRTADASRSPLDALSRLVVKPEVAGTDTLEAMVREMLRPMLRDWLDANLPAMVETMVAREIDRITGK